MNYKNEIKDFINSIYPLSESTWDDFLKHWELKEYERKDLISKEGLIEKYLYFTIEGIQRGSLYKKGKEYTTFLSFSPSFCNNIESFLTQTKANYNVEAITKSKLLRISFEELYHLKEKYEEVAILIEKLLVLLIDQIGTRTINLQTLTIEERFLDFMERWPFLLNRIPHKYIASYLNISDSNFSRLLNSVRI